MGNSYYPSRWGRQRSELAQPLRTPLRQLTSGRTPAGSARAVVTPTAAARARPVGCLPGQVATDLPSLEPWAQAWSRAHAAGPHRPSPHPRSVPSPASSWFDATTPERRSSLRGDNKMARRQRTGRQSAAWADRRRDWCTQLNGFKDVRLIATGSSGRNPAGAPSVARVQDGGGVTRPVTGRRPAALTDHHGELGYRIPSIHEIGDRAPLERVESHTRRHLSWAFRAYCPFL
ncbi:hypothetical protein Franean1_0683 [Parafrankia sp. EAN1pec]|nr:hypothetical protein Franean1_0683 [Frankia sp. EAN1pec]